MSLQEESPAQGNGDRKTVSRPYTRVVLWALSLSALLAGLATFALSACKGVR